MKVRIFFLLALALVQAACRASGVPVVSAGHVKNDGSSTDSAGNSSDGSEEAKSHASSDAVSAMAGADKTAKKPPGASTTGSVKTGLLAPESRELTSGPPLQFSKKRQRIVLNLDKVDIAQATSRIFGDQLKVNYVLDPALQDQISMYIEGEFDEEELLRLVARVYESNGVSVVPRNGFYSLQPSLKTAGEGLPIAGKELLEGDARGSRPLMVIYRLRYLDPKQVSSLIAPFLSQGRKSMAEPLSNSIIFVEETENARSILNILKTIDTDILQELSMDIVPLQSVQPRDAVQAMDTFLGKLGGLKESTVKNSLAFIPLQNFGGVFVMAHNPELLRSARQWLQAIDVQSAANGDQINVYFVQNGLATDIAGILNAAYGLTSSSSSRQQQQSVPSGKSPAQTSSGGSSSGSGLESGSSIPGSSSSKQSSRSPKTGTGIEKKPGGGIFTGEVVITADEVNNAIVVRANAGDYARIKKTLESLDILPRAVLIEVVIAEVQLTKEFEFGLEYYFQTHSSGETGLGASFGGLTKSTSSSSSTGFPTLDSGQGIAASWVSSAQDMAVFLTALSSKTNVTVLSNPTLLALDNKEATITVGGREPVPTGTYSTTASSTSAYSTIEYAETGVILNIMPHINAGGLVRLEVEQIIRSVDSDSVVVGSDNTAPRFTERNVKTTALTRDGTTAVIGGIIETNRNDTKSGIPFLQDVPLLSPLFAASTKNLTRTELLVAITPHVHDLRGSGASRELLMKLEALKESASR